MIHLTLVQTRSDFAQVAGWNEACQAKHPNVFGMFDGPTFYQGFMLSDAICNAVGSKTAVAPSEWPL